MPIRPALLSASLTLSLLMSGVAQAATTADRLWEALSGCAQFEGEKATFEILVVPDLSLGGIAVGAADVHVAVVSVEDDALLAHELAHNWPAVGPPFLGEGYASWLAQCALLQTGLRGRYDPGGAVGDIPNLREWDSLDQADPRTSSAYLASWRLLRLIEIELGAAALRGSAPHWSELERQLLMGSDTARLAALAFSSGSASEQAAVVHDADGDGLLSSEERASGTRADLADSDDNGIVDGASAPDGARALRKSMCVAEAWGASRVMLEAGSVHRSELVVVAGDRVTLREGEHVSVEPWRGPLRTGLDQRPSRSWVLVRGAVPAESPCVETSQITFWGDDVSAVQVRAFAARFTELLRRSETLFPGRLNDVHDFRLLAHSTVEVRHQDGGFAMASRVAERGDAAAFALARLLAPSRSPDGLIEALAQYLAEEEWPLGSTVAPGEFARWTSRAEICGWSALVDGTACQSRDR